MKLRMYINKGCPHCEHAERFFADKRIEMEIIQVGFDRVLQEGMRVLSGNGVGLPLPVIVSFETQEIITGADPSILERVAVAYGASPSNSNA